ncbi:MAG: hypothetical protein R3F17_06945 [Planctomycetota bacterium]
MARRKTLRSVRAAAWGLCARGLAVVGPTAGRRILRLPLRIAGLAGLGARIRRNLAAAAQHTGAPIDCDARAVLDHVARQAAEVAFLAHASPARRQRWLRGQFRDKDVLPVLRALLEQGRGVILLTAHVGNWEALAAYLADAGLQGSVVGRLRENDSIAGWLHAMRLRSGVETLAQDAPAEQALGVLKQGRLLGLLCDLEVRRLRGTFVPFLGHPALTMTAPAALARVSGAAILPVRCVIDPRNRSGYVLRAEAPLVWNAEAPRSQAQSELLQGMNDIYSRWILEDPEQWAWYEDRWRTDEAGWADRMRRVSAS